MDFEVWMPKFGMTMQEGTITQWLKKEGDRVEKGEALFVVETEKVCTEVESPASGILTKIIVREGETVPVGETVAIIAVVEEEILPVQVPELAEAVQPRPAQPVREEKEVPHGAQAIPLVGIRKTIAERMSESVRTMAQLTLVTEADATEMVELHDELRRHFDVSYTDLIVKIVALALQRHPLLNSRLEGEEIRILEEINVGVAVAVANGLVVPVIHNADRKSARDIAQETKVLTEKARQGSLAVEELTGGTFTVTNLGTYEIDAFTPIINPPQAAILGVGRISHKPAIYQGEIAKRAMIHLSLTFDHRVLDGAPAAEFLRSIKGNIEDPRSEDVGWKS